MGEPLLMWSLTADGQEDPKVFVERDKAFHVELRREANDPARQKP